MITIIMMFLFGWVATSWLTSLGMKAQIDWILKLTCQKCITLWLGIITGLFLSIPLMDIALYAPAAAYLAYIHQTIEEHL